MTSRIELNPQLCAMSTSALDRRQRNLIMAFLPYLGAPLSGSEVSQKTGELIESALESLQGSLGPWKVIWGPGVFQVLPDMIPANTMFVARHQETRELFISVAGTNPFSAYDWLVEDFEVSETRPWGYGSAPAGVELSKGTLNGLIVLQGMVPPTRMPGGNKALKEFLEAHLAQETGPIEVTVSGHSLGGALAATLGLWLLDTQKVWDPGTRATISVCAYAGPTPGNDDFASYIDIRFAGRLQRIANPLDIVPHAWNVGELAELKALYTPEIPRDASWDKAVDFLIAETNGKSYRQIDPRPFLLNGKVNKELVWRWLPTLVNIIGQVIYQHSLAYFELLGIPYPETRSAVGRRLAHETDAIAREILKRLGAGALLSRMLGVGLGLFARAYSRTPLMPSPIPETSARAREG